MRIRNGFVSNSSTSSFLIYGAHLEIEKARELTSKLGTGPELDEEVSGWAIHQYFEALVKDNNVKLCIESQNPDDYGLYIGRSWNEVGDNETGKEFKNKIESDILKLLNNEFKDVEFGTHEDAWYNG